jgi:hypothetical protein
LRQKFQDGTQTSFMPLVFRILTLILLECLVVLVNGIVSQVHEEIFEVVIGGTFILFGAKTD